MYYSTRELIKNIFFLAAVVAIMRVTGGAGFVVILPFALAAMAQRKPATVIFLVLMCTTMMMSNGNIVFKDLVFSLSQRALLVVLGFISMIQMSGHGVSPLVKPFLVMYIYLLFMIIPSVSGWNPKISFLKLFLFTMIYCAYIGSANNLARHNSWYALRKLRAVVLSIAIYFVLGSVALVPFPAISQLKAEAFIENPYLTSLFTGMANHSQSLGPLISSIGVVLLADLLFSIKKFDWLYVLLLTCCPYLIYLTSSRTGMGAFIFGILFVVWAFLNAQGMSSRWKSKVINVVMGLVIVLGIIVFANPKFQSKAMKFAIKWDDGGRGSIESVMMSRQAKFDQSISNFKKKPFLGNGFQVMEAQSGLKENGLLLTAPIEKGVWISAVLEEGGIIGFGIFVAFLVLGVLGSIRKRAYITASCLFVNTLTNLGEFTFFSMSYTGGFIWAMVFVGVAMDAQRLREEGRLRQLEMEYNMQMH